MEHIPERDLDRYNLGMVKNEAELAPLEEHLLTCAECISRAEESDRYIDLIRRALILGNYDVSQAGPSGFGGG